MRDKYFEPVNVLARSRRLAESARQTWSQLQLGQASGPNLLLGYLKSVYAAANATGRRLAHDLHLDAVRVRSPSYVEYPLAYGL